MPAPTFAVTRTGQQPVDDLFIRVRRLVGQKSVQLFARRRQADQVEINSPQQDVLGRRRQRLQAKSLVIDGQKCIDRVFDAGDVAEQAL